MKHQMQPIPLLWKRGRENRLIRLISLTIKHHQFFFFMWSSNTIQLKWSIFTLKTYYDRWNHPVSDFDLLLLSFILFCHNIFQNTITSIPRLLSFSSFWDVCYILLFWTCFLFFNWSFFRKIHACVFAFAPMEKNVT